MDLPRSGLVALLGFAGLALIYPPVALGCALAAGATMAAAFLERRARAKPKEGAPAGRLPLRGGEQASRVLQGLSDPALIVDRELFVLFANDAALRTFGSMAAGDPVTLRFRSPQISAMAIEAFSSGAPREALHQEGGRAQRIWSLNILPIRPDPGARVDHALFHFRDRTAEHRAERMRADFVANASHELRTPLASLIGFIETLQGPAREDAVARARFLSIMRDQAGRMSRLIDDLMSLSRIETRARLSPDDRADLVAVLSDVQAQMASLAQEVGLRIELDLAGFELLEVMGDRDELVQVFCNLLENACRYAAGGGRVVLGLRPAGEAVDAFVQDFGPGIEPAHLPRLTERFYRADSGAFPGGTGLGLSIVRNILLRHGTRLSIRSKPGEGSVFSIRFQHLGDTDLK